ncbi:MAG: Ppx/GppA family phosphatase, partial [Campylobacterales bacterium]|nr:Ppx/GppA family phosphatase [Campylobacterales bacterium]
MAKRTAVIDIGSNSVRMVIFERTSRFGFHLLCEEKSSVRISQGMYDHGTMLQEAAIQRAVGALEDFLHITKSYKVRKTFCVATSAVRDAVNKNDFLQRVRSRLGLNIKVIDGSKEAYYGG